MAERVAVVTGTTSGIGREVARSLAQRGYTVVMHGRDRARTEAAVEDVRRSAADARVAPAVADLAVRAEVERLADEIRGYGPIAALIHNAAVVPHERRTTPDGVELTFATNVLAPFVLTHRVGRRLEGGRVITFFGGSGTTLPLDDLQAERGPFDGWDVYCRSKNALAALTLEWSRRHAQPAFLGVLPGLVYTEGMRTLPGRMVWVGRLGWPLMRTPAQGARTPVWAATAPELAGRTGRFYGNLLGRGWRNELAIPPVATAPEAGRRVFEACAALAGGAELGA